MSGPLLVEVLSDEAWDEVWNAVLGPFPDEMAPGGNPYGNEGSARGPGDYDSWPPQGEGPHNGVFWHRWIEEQLIADGATVEAARALRITMRRGLQTGDLKAISVHVDGRAHPIPQEAWQAAGGTRFLWWSGFYWFEGELGNVYLIDPTPPAPPKKAPAAELGSRAANNVARLVYGLARIAYDGDVDKHGIIAEIARDLAKMGLGMSDDTVAKWIKAGRELYDPMADATRNPN